MHGCDHCLKNVEIYLLNMPSMAFSINYLIKNSVNKQYYLLKVASAFVFYTVQLENSIQFHLA